MQRSIPNRLLFGGILVSIVILALALWAPLRTTSAHPLVPSGSHWAVSPVKYRDATDNYWGNVWSRKEAFNDSMSNVQIVESLPGDKVRIGDAHYGLNSWEGLCSGTAWVYLYIDLNEDFLEDWDDGNKTSALIAHEMGHCFGGVAHHDATGRIMQNRAELYYDDDGVMGI